MQHWVRTVFEELTWADDNVPRHTRQDLDRIVRLLEGSDVHVFRTEEFEAAAHQIQEAEDLNELSKAMWKITTSLAFQNFAIFVLKQGPGAQFESRICTSYNEGWIARYVDERYQYIDPIMAKASVSEVPFLYSEIPKNSPAIESFWQDAEQYRIGRNGVCFVVTKGSGTRIGVTFSTQADEQSVKEIFRRNSYDLGCLAQLAADTFCFSASGCSLPDDTLSEDELRFLHVLSASSNPQDALKVSSCFGSNTSLQASIRSKLGVESVFQAVAIASSKGWFDLLPYGSDEISKPFASLHSLDFD